MKHVRPRSWQAQQAAADRREDAENAARLERAREALSGSASSSKAAAVNRQRQSRWRRVRDKLLPPTGARQKQQTVEVYTAERVTSH